MLRRTLILTLVTIFSSLLTVPVIANPAQGGVNLPWETPLITLEKSISGPTATAIIFIAIAISLAIWSFSDSRHLMRAAQAVIALAIIVKLGDFLNKLSITAACIS